AGGLVAHVRVLDVAGHPLCEGGQERLDLVGRPFRDQLDRAVGPVADVTADGKPLGDVPRRPAEADALDAAGVGHVLADGHAGIVGPFSFQAPPGNARPPGSAGRLLSRAAEPRGRRSQAEPGNENTYARRFVTVRPGTAAACPSGASRAGPGSS